MLYKMMYKMMAPKINQTYLLRNSFNKYKLPTHTNLGYNFKQIYLDNINKTTHKIVIIVSYIPQCERE